MAVRARTLALVTASALLIAAPAASAATGKWFGADLTRPANATATCQSFSFFQVVKSCSWTTSGALFNPKESMVVPGRGKITKIRIKVGSSTGPMRFAILRSLRRENAGETACCIGRYQSSRFTPARNKTKKFDDLSIPVTVKFNSVSRIWSIDNLFLTVDNNSTVIPASSGNPDGFSAPCSGGWFPAVRPGKENFTGPYGACGYTILIKAYWVKT